MKVTDLKADPIINEWLTTLNPKRHTERNYLLAMQIYTDWLSKSPNDLLLEAERESTLLMRQRHLKGYLINFRKFLQETRAPTTVKSYMTGVKSFYTLFDIELPTLPRQDKKARTLEKNNKIPIKDELQEVLKICDPLEKAILLVGASSGLSAQEIINLKVKDIKYDSEFITTLAIRREKTGVDFCTFLTPEATNALIDYLSFRSRTGKTKNLAQHEKQKIFSDDNYLFIKRHVPESFSETHNDEERALDLEALVKIYRAISVKAKKNTPLGDWNIIRSHNIRKYFNSALLNAGADSFHVEFFMGHTLDDTRAAYFRAKPEDLKEIYKKYVPYLTIQKELDISESTEYKTIIKENEVLRAETSKHIVERKELQNLRDEVEKLKKVAKDSASIDLELLKAALIDPEVLKELTNRLSA